MVYTSPPDALNVTYTVYSVAVIRFFAVYFTQENVQVTFVKPSLIELDILFGL